MSSKEFPVRRQPLPSAESNFQDFSEAVWHSLPDPAFQPTNHPEPLRQVLVGAHHTEFALMLEQNTDAVPDSLLGDRLLELFETKAKLSLAAHCRDEAIYNLGRVIAVLEAEVAKVQELLEILAQRGEAHAHTSRELGRCEQERNAFRQGLRRESDKVQNVQRIVEFILAPGRPGRKRVVSAEGLLNCLQRALAHGFNMNKADIVDLLKPHQPKSRIKG